jgi:flagellar biosynthetic protein FlhB
MAEETQRDEKTEEATPRRREEARAKGQVAMSNETVAVLMLIATLAALLLGGAQLAEVSGGIVVGSLGALHTIGTRELALPDAAGLIREAFAAVTPAAMVLILPAILVGLLVAYGQIGFRLAPKAVSLDPAKLNPLKGFGRLFSMRSVVRTSLSAARIVVIITSVVAVALAHLGELSAMPGTDLGTALAMGANILVRCLIAGVLAMLSLALVDLVFQRLQHTKELRMTKKEVKDELKSTDGDPHVKSRIRQIQRELASRRMMADVPKATVVVTNPTHFAVALHYDRIGENGGAPYVVAKGVDLVAQRIKEVAREAGVIVYEDRPLARALHASTEIGDVIPAELFQAVASVLAYVYRIQGEPVPA